MAFNPRENSRRYRRDGAAETNQSPTSKGRTGSRYHLRSTHPFDAPTIGRIMCAGFVQRASAEERTIEIVRYAGVDVWKARIKETGLILSRLGQQVEYASESAACSDVTEFFKSHGLVVIRQWEAIYPEWSAAAVSPAPRPMIPGGVQQ